MELVRTDMEHLTKETLHELIELSGSPFLSIYLPTHRRGGETEQDPIRLKNLVSKAEAELLAMQQPRPEVASLLEPLQTLVEDYEFWQHQSNGLAIFRTADYFETYRLPLRFEELVVVGDRPHIKPLLPLLMAHGHFHLLALSQNQVRFFEATQFQIGEVELQDTPTSLDEAMRYDEFEDQLQFHTQTGRTTDAGGRAAIFHGHSDAGDEAVIKENIKRFLHRVDDGVRNYAENNRTPLVLAGVDTMRGLYTEVSQYPTIVEQGVGGNPEMQDAKELHEAAWPLVEALFMQTQQDAADVYMHLAGTEDARASDDLAEIVSAAFFQRVDTLFVPTGQERWGKFDAENSVAEVHPEQKSGDMELLDFAAANTLINGGTVYALTPEKIPGRESVAAIFRY